MAVEEKGWPGGPFAPLASLPRAPPALVPVHSLLASGSGHRSLPPLTSCPASPCRAAGAKGHLAHC